MTVREAFAKAGHPVPDGAKVFEWDGLHAWQGDTTWHFVIASLNGRIGWTLTNGSWAYRQPVDLSNLPAIDAYDALPDVVRKVVER